MEYFAETVALGLDAIVFGVCFSEYIKHKSAINKIKSAPYFEINRDLAEIVKTHPDKKLPYVTLRGIVRPIGSPIISTNNPQVTGVVQALTIREHVVQRSTTGFWSDQERVIHEAHNCIPFVLNSNGFEVEVLDPLAAEILDMDVISNQFNSNEPRIMDHVWALFFGIKQKGVQTTEKMLRANTYVTGIGELATSSDGKSIQLQPPSNGASYYLTNMQVTSLLRKLEGSKKFFKILSLICATIGVVIGGIILRELLKKRQEKFKKLKRDEELQTTRRERRRQVRGTDIPETQLCIVCKINPRETILLPCGHVCLCEDCSDSINDYCPVCRRSIVEKKPAYIS